MAGHLRRISACLLLGLLLWAGLDVRLGETAVRAQDFPKRAITLVVPRPAGGMSERLAELLAPPLSRAFGVPVNIRLMPGDMGGEGARYVVAAPADGYTLMVAPSTLLLFDPTTLPNLGFVPERDLDPVLLAIRMPTVLVVQPAVAARSLSKLEAEIRAKPDLVFGASAKGSINDLLAAEMFRRARMPRNITYLGGGGAVEAALLKGQVQASFQEASISADDIDRALVRALAITGDERSPRLPGVPTFAELGAPEMNVFTWQAVVAPAGLKEDVRAALENGLKTALLDRTVVTAMQAIGAEVVAAGSRQLSRVLTEERVRWRELGTADPYSATTR